MRNTPTSLKDGRKACHLLTHCFQRYHHKGCGVSTIVQSSWIINHCRPTAYYTSICTRNAYIYDVRPLELFGILAPFLVNFGGMNALWPNMGRIDWVISSAVRLDNGIRSTESIIFQFMYVMNATMSYRANTIN